MIMTRFPKNSRVCFIGDSITCANGYLSHIVNYYEENFKGENIKFFNCGISGAASKHLLDAFDFDVASYEPTHAVIFMGVNDTDRSILAKGRSPEIYTRLKNNFENYKKNLDIMCKRIEALGARVILCTSTPLDEYSKFDTEVFPGSFALMMGYAEHVRNYAREKGYPVCDYISYFSEVLQSGAVIYETDRVHPNALGAWHIAKCFLAFQGLDIGERRELSPAVAAWKDLVTKYRYMITAQLFLTKAQYTMAYDDVKELAAEGLEKENTPFFQNLYNIFTENKPNEAALKAEILKFI